MEMLKLIKAFFLIGLCLYLDTWGRLGINNFLLADASIDYEDLALIRSRSGTGKVEKVELTTQGKRFLQSMDDTKLKIVSMHGVPDEGIYALLRSLLNRPDHDTRKTHMDEMALFTWPALIEAAMNSSAKVNNQKVKILPLYHQEAPFMPDEVLTTKKLNSIMTLLGESIIYISPFNHTIYEEFGFTISGQAGALILREMYLDKFNTDNRSLWIEDRHLGMPQFFIMRSPIRKPLDASCHRVETPHSNWPEISAMFRDYANKLPVDRVEMDCKRLMESLKDEQMKKDYLTRYLDGPALAKLLEQLIELVNTDEFLRRAQQSDVDIRTWTGDMMRLYENECRLKRALS